MHTQNNFLMRIPLIKLKMRGKFKIKSSGVVVGSTIHSTEEKAAAVVANSVV